MRIFTEVHNIDGEHILSRNVAFDGGYYNVDAFQRFFTKLDDMVLGREVNAIKFVSNEGSKKFTLTLTHDKEGEYQLKDTREKIKHSIDQIIDDTVDYFRITRDDLFRRTRKAKYLKPQQFTCLLLWIVGGLSLKESGAYFGKGHATVLNSIRKAIPGHFMANDTDIVGAVNYFSVKYDIELKPFVIEQFNKETRLRYVVHG